jgi:trigger factor
MTDEHKSETVSVKVKREPFCKVTLETIATTTLVAQARKEAVKKVSKKVSIPGFRKGKAPESVILKSFGKAVDEEWEKTIADQAFRDVQALVHVPILNGNSQIVFDMKKHSMDGAEMTFAFETEPTLPEIDYKKITLESPKRPPITSKEVEATLEKICSYFGKVERITDRPAQEGDAVHIDVNLIKEKDLTPVFNNTRFEVREKKMAKWMRDLVLGMQVGESKDGVSKPDEDATDEEKKNFEPKDVRVTLISIENVDLPPLDDEMAQKLGVSTADEAKEKVELLLNKQADEEIQRSLREDVSERLIEDFPFEVPETVVAREAEHRLQSQQKNEQFRTKWRGLSEEERTEMRKQITVESGNAIRLFYVCRKIAQENGIKAKPADLSQGVTSTLDAMFADPALLNATPGSEQESIALSRVMLSKAQDFVISQSTVKEKSAGAKKTTSAKPAAKKPAAKKPAATKQSATAKKPATAKTPAAKKPAAAKKTAAKKKST